MYNKQQCLTLLRSILIICDSEMYLSPSTFKKYVKLMKYIEKDFKLFNDLDEHKSVDEERKADQERRNISLEEVSF